jgi:hypothetical protein
MRKLALEPTEEKLVTTGLQKRRPFHFAFLNSGEHSAQFVHFQYRVIGTKFASYYVQ